MRAALLFLLIGTAHAGSISRAAARLPDAPAPPFGQVNWIAESMRMNGLPMTIKAVYAQSSVEELFYFYESWSKQLPDAQTRRWHTASSEVLSIKAANSLITIEVERALRGAQGTIVTTAPIERAALVKDTSFPHPSSLEVANLQQYEDDGREAEHIIFTSSRAPFLETQAMAGVLDAQGWTIVGEHPSETATQSYVIEAQRNAEQARITIAPDRSRRTSTMITVIWRKG
jgi:hypothetical protein